MKRTYILFLIVAAIAMLLAASEVRAENGYPYPAISAPRTCTATLFDGESYNDIARIEAGPAFDGYDESGNPRFSDVGLNAQFPLTVICDPETDKPGCPSWLGLTGPYLRWDYRFTPTSESWNATAFVLSVASDVEIDATSAMRVSLPGEGDTYASVPPFGRGIYEARILTFDFTYYSTPWIGYYFTPVGFDPRVASAGAVRFEDEAVTCLLAGAGRGTVELNQPVPDAQSYNLPGTPCTLEYRVAANGKVIPGTMQIISGGENCTIEETTEPIMIDGKEVVYVGPVQFTLPGSCRFCWVNTYGGKTCSNCTTCCVGTNSGTCQSRATVINNGDQCMPGT